MVTIVNKDFAVTVEASYSFTPAGFTVNVKDAIGHQGTLVDLTADEARAMAAALLQAADDADTLNA